MKKQMARRIATALLSGAIAFSSTIPVLAAPSTNDIDNVSYESVDAFTATTNSRKESTNEHEPNAADENVDKTRWSGKVVNLQRVVDPETGAVGAKKAAQIESFFTKLGDSHNYSVKVCTSKENNEWVDGGKNGWRFTMIDQDVNIKEQDITTSDKTAPNPGQGLGGFGTTSGSGLSEDDNQNIDNGTETKNKIVIPGKQIENKDYTDAQDTLGQDLYLEWKVIPVDSEVTATINGKDVTSNGLVYDQKLVKGTDYTVEGNTVTMKDAVLSGDHSLKVTVNAFGTYRFKIQVTPYWENEAGEKTYATDDKNNTISAYTGAYASLPLSKPALKAILDDKDYAPATEEEAKNHINEILSKNVFKSSANESANLSVVNVKLDDVKDADGKVTGQNANVLLKAVLKDYEGKSRTIYIRMGNTANNIEDPNGENTDLGMNTKDAETDFAISFGSSTKSDKSAFSDVPSTAYYADAVNWTKNNKIVAGYPDGRFGSLDSVTREQFVQILYNAAGSPEVSEDQKKKADAKFADYNKATFGKDAIAWAVDKNYISGDGKNFNPTGNLSREDLVVILYNIAKDKDIVDSETKLSAISFSDVDPAKYYSSAVDWAARKGVSSGRPDGTFGVKTDVNRADAVVFLSNLNSKLGTDVTANNLASLLK